MSALFACTRAAPARASPSARRRQLSAPHAGPARRGGASSVGRSSRKESCASTAQREARWRSGAHAPALPYADRAARPALRPEGASRVAASNLCPYTTAVERTALTFAKEPLFHWVGK